MIAFFLWISYCTDGMWITYRILYTTQTLKLKFQAQGVASNINITVDFYDEFRA